jgi:hypothetical protein
MEVKSAAIPNLDAPPDNVGRHSTNYRRLTPPTLKLYSPTRQFDISNPTTYGCALQFECKKESAAVGAFLTVAPQISPVTSDGNANFDWRKSRIEMKLNIWELGHILSVLNDKRDSALFENESHEGKTRIEIKSIFSENELSGIHFAFAVGNEPPLRAFLDASQSEPLRVFVEGCIERILFARM